MGFEPNSDLLYYIYLYMYIARCKFRWELELLCVFIHVDTYVHVGSDYTKVELVGSDSRVPTGYVQNVEILSLVVRERNTVAGFG